MDEVLFPDPFLVITVLQTLIKTSDAILYSETDIIHTSVIKRNTAS